MLLASGRFLRFIRDHEKGDPPNAEAAAEVKLTQEQIQEAGKQFGITLEDAHDLLSMRKTMQQDKSRDWVNACGYLQILQNTLVKGQYEDRSDGLWKQAVVRHVVMCSHATSSSPACCQQAKQNQAGKILMITCKLVKATYWCASCDPVCKTETSSNSWQCTRPWHGATLQKVV